MYNHYFDENRVYQCSVPAYPDTVPSPDCLRSGKELAIPDGYWPVLNAAGDGWVMTVDHRGKEGWVDGKAVRIDAVGPLPEGWSEEPPELPDNRPPAEKRQDAYTMEADPLFMQAQYYQAEAEGLRLLDKVAEAAMAEEIARGYLRQYAEKKAAIRVRIPDAAPERYRLASSGTYHRESCSFVTEAMESLTLGEIAEKGNGKPCGRCKPPAAEEGRE